VKRDMDNATMDIDGLKLTELMIVHRVVVQVARRVEVVKIDEAFFSDD